MTDDAFDDLLRRPAAACDDDLRHAIFEQTTQVLRRRALPRRIAFGVAVAAGVLLVIAGVFSLRPGERREGPAREPGSIVQTPAPEVPATNAPAAVIERLGETSADGQRAVLYRRAGDRYLEEEADPQDALRCYTQALDEGSDNALTISADDSWLLMALKMDRQKKEKTHANRD
jgi:hypothetical protein